MVAIGAAVGTMVGGSVIVMLGRMQDGAHGPDVRMSADMIPDRSKAARELLAFYAEAGVDAAIGEEANDWLAGDRVAAPRHRACRAPVRSQQFDGRARLWRPAAPAPPAPDAAVMAAREAARSAASLDELRAILDRFDGCA